MTIRVITIAFLGLCIFCSATFGKVRVTPLFSVWDLELGRPISNVPDAKVGEIACGTIGGPKGTILESFLDFLKCKKEESGLREVVFTYDDEQDYIALALGSQYKFLYGGTSVFAHPVIVSLLVDQKGIVQGRRIFTDDRISDYERRNAFTLIRNFKARFGKWNLNCVDIGMKEGEQPVGNQFIHEQCIGRSIDGITSIAIKATYLRKKGQRGINRTTQEVNQGYFESQTKYEEVLAPYKTTILP